MNGSTRAPLEVLEESLGHRFRDPELLGRALRHGSAVAAGDEGSYERLEFLGDAVLGLALARLLFDRFPDADQGRLTRMRAHLARSESLATKAAEIGLDGWIETGRSEHRHHGHERPALLEDVFEAVLGAMAMDGGLELAVAFVRDRFAREIDELDERTLALADPKTALQEAAQGRDGARLEYHEVKVAGPDHRRTFTYAVIWNGEEIARGEDRSKRGAQVRAARRALVRLGLVPDE